ncbi:PadR family transcriptional regulator [Candidatus Contubernalis alkaliaceticus]|uniref:PadR family transcriptional regulator n=1 Tax=Candidatus Contubernalis alkaliaceticus TaxID=338645 RepID=UPI001F4BE282|nr:PadR family transcriptional regulator [Candidatus Contubernalis alkalaceticus]UNC91991.1 helix-turn-helix transcriptional regulator [Candidatus Contubernalis alkalaceticus]
MNREKFLPLTETTYYILLALSSKPFHGYAIMQKIEELSKGTVRIAAGTLYGALENLVKQKLIIPVQSENKRRKTYKLTDMGKSILFLDCERMEHMVAITKATNFII